jgi:predicted AlkP superfamily phosphohydrolase/phosphomutase
VNPGKHGVFGFLRFDGYEWDVVNATDVRSRTLWEYLDYHELTSVVVNAPVTHPPPEIDGAIIPGYIGPEDPECHPDGILDELREKTGPYRVYAPSDGKRSVEHYRSLIQMRGRAFRWLADRFDPDFGFLQFQQTDTVFHERPGDHEAVRAVYEAVDREVGEVLRQCAPEVVVVVSDHGMGEYRGGEIRVNDYLHSQGYLETANGGVGMPSWNMIATERLQAGLTERDDRSTALDRLVGWAAKAGLTSQRIGAALERIGLAEFVLRHVPRSAIRAGSEQVDFPASIAYMRERIELGVRLNVESREPNGIVPPEEYEHVRSTLIERLRNLRTSEGEPVFERVDPREAHFHGPYVDEAVDIVTIPAGYDHFVTAQLRGAPFSPEPQEPWNHKLEGVVAIAGDGVDANASLGAPTLFDVAPTVLATFGLPHDEWMDGAPLPAVQPIGPREYPAYDPTPTRETADAAVENRLANLGYLED